MIMHLGLIIPSSNTVMEEEYSPFITVHSTRIPLHTVDESHLTHMNTDLQKAIQLIMDCQPDVIAYGCTSGSFLQDITNFFAAITIPWIITAQAVLSALLTVGAQTVSVVTPYIDEINTREKQFLEDNGFTVNSIVGMGIRENTQVGMVSSDEVLTLAQSLPDSDTIFLSCTNMRTFPIIQQLENTRGVPVISSNSATLWKAFQQTGEGPIHHHGSLMEEWL